MNLYEYQRSRSFIDLSPRSLRLTFSNFFSLETAKTIEAKFQMEPPWDGGMKICSNGPGHMSIAAMPIYGKNLKKIFSGTLKVGMQHWLLEYYQVCSNDDPELTFPYFMVKFGPLCFCIGKRLNNRFFRNYCSL